MKPQDYRHDHAYFLIQDESVRAIVTNHMDAADAAADAYYAAVRASLGNRYTERNVRYGNALPWFFEVTEGDVPDGWDNPTVKQWRDLPSGRWVRPAKKSETARALDTLRGAAAGYSTAALGESLGIGQSIKIGERGPRGGYMMIRSDVGVRTIGGQTVLEANAEMVPEITGCRRLRGSQVLAMIEAEAGEGPDTVDHLSAAIDALKASGNGTVSILSMEGDARAHVMCGDGLGRRRVMAKADAILTWCESMIDDAREYRDGDVRAAVEDHLDELIDMLCLAPVGDGEVSDG